MPIDDLTALGQKMREARKNKELTQQELADLSHVSVKQIANIEKGKMNPSYLILRALAKVLHISLDTLINPDVSLEDERPVKVTKDIYPVIARKYKSTPSNVEHNIRTLVNLCWMNHKDTLEEMAGCTMADKPTNSEFIDILVYYLRYSDKD